MDFLRRLLSRRVSRWHRAEEDTNALAEAKTRLPLVDDDHTFQRTYVTHLGRVVEHSPALTVHAGQSLDPATPGAGQIGFVLDQRRLPFLDARCELLLDGGADDLRPVGGEE